MKVILPEKKTFRKREIAIYIIIMVICIISIIVAFYFQFYSTTDFKNMLGIETNIQIGDKTKEQIEIEKVEFEQIFTNKIENEENQENKRKEIDKPLIYTKVEKKESKINSYDIEVHIPYINIDNPKIDEYNHEIESFVEKTNSVLASQNRNTIYTVEYTANIYNDILSLIIRSNLKEGSSAQRVIIETFNYDLKNDKEITLEEVLKIENLEKSKIQENIKSEIQIEQKKVEDLKNLGYNIYSRDVASDIYNVENTKEFYLTSNTLYVIYAYGNGTFTSEMDLIVI